MELKPYEELITHISQTLAERFLSEEENISKRALLLDGDISEITRKIGLETTQRIYEETVQQHVAKKNKTD